MSTIFEGPKSYQWISPSRLVEEDHERAWAEPYVRRSEDVRWILGSYVQSSTENAKQYNSNGHLFPYEDLKSSIKDIPYRPLNFVHIPNRKIGCFAGAEFVYPEGSSVEEGTINVEMPPIVEALACFWLYYDQGLWHDIEMSHKDGTAFFSMEAVPEQVECAACKAVFDYDGPTSKTYCDHLQNRRAKKTLHKPHFLAGALIIPPVKPGWDHAHIKEISQAYEADTDYAHSLYQEIAQQSPQLTDAQINNVMNYVMSELLRA